MDIFFAAISDIADILLDNDMLNLCTGARTRTIYVASIPNVRYMIQCTVYLPGEERDVGFDHERSL